MKRSRESRAQDRAHRRFESRARREATPLDAIAARASRERAVSRDSRARTQPGGMISSSATEVARDDTVRQGAAAGYRDPVIGRDRGRVGLIIDQSGAFALPRACRHRRNEID